MTLRVRFTPAADAEFLAVIAHIGADSPSAAVAFKNKALHALSRLGDAVWIVAVWHGAQLVNPPESGVSG